MFLLDSVILIDHFNAIEDATAFIRKFQTQCAISVITRAELLVGFTEKHHMQVKSFLDKFIIHEINAEIADLAAHLRRKHRWKLPDAFQAAIAVHHQLKLITRNTKDFSPSKHDFVKCPYVVV